MVSKSPSKTALFMRYIPIFAYKHLPLLFAFLGIALMILRFKVLTVVLLFLTVDIINSYVNFNYKLCVPVDFFLMLVLILSYHNQMMLAIMISPLVLLSRGLLGKLELRHVYKIPILVISSILMAGLSFLNIVLAGVIVIGIRYLLEYLMQAYLLGGINADRFVQRSLNYIGGYGFLALFGRILLAFLG
ncbi:MAG: hypothetical protein ABIJ34_03255 [archaeon]